MTRSGYNDVARVVSNASRLAQLARIIWLMSSFGREHDVVAGACVEHAHLGACLLPTRG